MRRFLHIMLSVFLVILCAGAAGALTLTDTTLFAADGTISSEDYIDHGWGDVDFLDGLGDYVHWAHHYTFNPAAGTINSAELVLSFADDERDRWYNPFSWEVGYGIAESFQWDVGDIDSGDYSYSINVAYLGDGYFEVLVGSMLGDFSIESSVLTIDYDVASPSGSSPVPEPATMLLLGAGLIGMAGISRKKLD